MMSEYVAGRPIPFFCKAAINPASVQRWTLEFTAISWDHAWINFQPNTSSI
jgi:hypothetical protein